jgi:hypothetical protein
MTLLTLIIVLILIGVLLYFIPMDGNVKQIIIVVLVIVIIIYLLRGGLNL